MAAVLRPDRALARTWRLTAWLMAAGAGLGVPLSLAPFNLWPLGMLAVAAHLLLLRRAEARSAFALGYWFGVGKYGLGASWVYVSINVYGHAGPALAGALVVLFVSTLALCNAALAFCWRRWAAAPGWRGDIAFAGAWVLLDMFLTWFLTGFPWLYLGYGHLHDWLAGFAPVFGVHGVTCAAALCGVALTWVGRDRRALTGGVLVAGLALGGLLLQQIAWVRPVRSMDVVLVQGNIAQDTKWDEAYVTATLHTYLTLTAPYWDRALILWPETAVTMLLDDAGPFLHEVGARAEAHGGAVVTGIASWRAEEGIRNLTVVAGNGSGSYVKRHLVPFGEYVPLEGLLRGLIGFFDLPMSHTTPGAPEQPLLRVGRTRIAMAICYEIVYPDLVRGLGAQADLLATVSNDSWFGGSIGPLQHMQMARMRALELGRWLVRATNNGVTGVVDERGEVVKVLPQFVAAALPARVWIMAGATPFSRTGSWPIVLLAAVLTAAGAVRRSQRTPVRERLRGSQISAPKRSRSRSRSRSR